MPDSLPLKKITIIRIITMVCGQLGAILMLAEYDFLKFGVAQRTNLTNVLIALVGVGCFIYMVKQIRILSDLRKKQ